MRSSRLAVLRTAVSAARADRLCADLTQPERLLWYYLRDRKLEGFKFHRQVPVGPFVADFLCEQRRLIVEVDGIQHAEYTKADALRTNWLAANGYQVVGSGIPRCLKKQEGCWGRYWRNCGTLTPALSQGRGRRSDLQPGPLPSERRIPRKTGGLPYPRGRRRGRPDAPPPCG
jgi:very-short-patch-repair endonuclease